MALSNAILDQFLQIGKWSTTAEDDVYGELFPQDFFRKIYTDYKADPTNQSNIDAVGLLPLGLAVSGWGISDPDGLPDDPDGRNWAGTSSIGSGKHIMSYAKGGVGIPHADSSFLQAIIEEIKSNHSNMAPKFDQFYALKGTNFDKLYANGGHCTEPVSTIMVDLNGKTFGHKKWGYASDNYCSTYNTKATTAEDWQVFRHWIRAALRKRDMQNFIISYWMERYWRPSYEKTLAAGGSIAEAIINTRVRNSGSSKANRIIGQSIDEQLTEYGKERRWGVMLRSANVWEAYEGEIISVKPGATKNTSPWTQATSSPSEAVPAPVAEPAPAEDTRTAPSAASLLGNAAGNIATQGSKASTQTGTVTASKLNIRSGPSTSNDKVGSALPKGTALIILETSDDQDWYHVTTPDGRDGWVAAQYVVV